MNPKKLIFALFFIINPILYFTIFAFVMPYFNGRSILESGDTALSNIAIYSVTISICWLISSDKLEEAIEADMKAKKENQT